MSAESGISTFRDADGLWEGHDVMSVASPAGWQKNQSLVLDFYNQRRKQLHEVAPNRGHILLQDLEASFDVRIITQNVDNLHEAAGSKNILHLHGELFKVRSTIDASLVYEWKGDLKEGDLCEKGSQLRPHIVWFGEMVPMLDNALEICATADILVVIGTSLLVYPAASLIHCVPPSIPMFIIDPNIPQGIPNNFRTIEKGASEGVQELMRLLEV